MTINVTMIRTALGADDRQWRAGDTYAAEDDFARALIGRGDAYAADVPMEDVTAFLPISAADIATTTGAEGESRQISDGADEGGRIIWTSTTENPTPSWRWWLWPDSIYGE